MPAEGLIEVVVISPSRLLFEGKVSSIILPGENGVFEIQPHHKRIFTRLFGGKIILDGATMAIRRGIAKAALNRVTVIVEEGLQS